jgi:hypothetical protein
VFAALGTVASPGPVAGLGVTRAAPDADRTLRRLVNAGQLIFGNRLSITLWGPDCDEEW